MDGEPRSKEELEMRNDLAPLPSSSGDLVKYLVAELYVESKDHDAFQKEMKDLVELMFDYKRWELVFASYPVTGQLNRFVHIWRIPDESDVLEVMRVGALNTGEKKAPDDAKTLEEEFRFCYRNVQSKIVETKHTLVSSLPYDPSHVGYQSQTIVLDVDGDVIIIDHDQLRANGRDIAADLEKVRRARPKIRRGKPVSRDSTSLNEKGRFETIQGHLNRGSMFARIGKDDSQELLFNLAALKPRSVYQPIDTAKFVIPRPQKDVEQKKGNDEVNVPPLLIATPWGAVYEVNGNDLQTFAKLIAKDDNRDDARRIRAAVQPILDGGTPLAAIPEERDSIIGDGCACFVINLNSFLSHGSDAKSQPAAKDSSK